MWSAMSGSALPRSFEGVREDDDGGVDEERDMTVKADGSRKPVR